MSEQDRPRESETPDAGGAPGDPGSATTGAAEAAAAENASADNAAGGATATDAAAAQTPARASAAAGPSTANASTASRWLGGAGRRRLIIAAACVVVFGVLAAWLAGTLLSQKGQFAAALDEANAATSAELDAMRGELGRVSADIARVSAEFESLDEELLARRAELARVEQRLDTVPGRFTALEQRLDAVQGGAFDARAQWLRAETEYYLALANTELNLAGRWDNAAAALQLADEKLRELGNPRFNGVRSAIAAELQALASVRLPDIAGLVFSLGELAERVESLPMRAEAPENFATGGADLDAAEPGLSRLWLGLKGAVSGIIRVERREDESAVQLSAQARALVRRQLVLELELARLSALRAETAGFQAGLESALRLLRQDFDAGTGAVEGAIALLSEMRDFEIAPARPDIGTSLSALRNTSLGSD